MISKKSTQKPGAKRGRKRKEPTVRRSEPAAAVAAEQEQTTRDGSPAPSEASMPSPARTASVTSICSNETSSLSVSSSHSVPSSSASCWDSDPPERNGHSDVEAVGEATARREYNGNTNDCEDMAVQNTVPTEIKVKTAAVVAAAAEAAAVNLQRHHQQKATVSPSVSRSGSPSLTDMLLEPPTPPRRQLLEGADGCDGEVNNVLDTSGETAGTIRLSRGEKTSRLQQQITYVSGTAAPAVAGPAGGDVLHLAQHRVGGQSVAGATTAAALHQITSQPWELSDTASFARWMPIPVFADNSTSRGHMFKQQQQQHGGAGASESGVVTTSVPAAAAAAPAPSPFGGALLPQQGIDFRDLGGLGMDLGECPAMMGDMVPSLTREMSLVRAVAALGNEQQVNGGDMVHDESVVLSPWYD